MWMSTRLISERQIGSNPTLTTTVFLFYPVALAERLGNGLQTRTDRFDSGGPLQIFRS